MPAILDTIVAPITGSQPAAVALVRLSGSEAWVIAASVFPSWPSPPESHRAVFGSYVTGDDGLALPFAEGHSYTGEQSAELSVHGSPVSVRRLVDACLRAGARLAEAGEFTQRAFLNGRIDLSQAEAVADTVAAETEAQLKLANLHRSGALRTIVSALREDLTKLLAAVEASVDFSEEVGDLDRPAALATLREVVARLQPLYETREYGRILRQGLRIAIVGPPNAGKSSLLNALLQSDRSIVTPIPGTTRDYVEEKVDLGGVPCVLIDTAGLRDTEDLVESLGVQRTRAIAAEADWIWYLFDATNSVPSIPKFSAPVTRVANKWDLPGAVSHGDINISAVTGLGLVRLITSVQELSGIGQLTTLPWVNPRQATHVEEAMLAVQNAIQTVEHHLPDDLLTVNLQAGIEALGQISGETVAPDMIHRIFHDFCIGK